jgi:anti-anti-sigma factor
MSLIGVEHVQGTTYVVRPYGEIDLAVAPEFRACLLDVLDAGARFLVIDVSAVIFFDSTALKALIAARRRAEDLGGGVVVAGAGGVISEVFEVTGLDAVFGLHESVEAALAAS